MEDKMEDQEKCPLCDRVLPKNSWSDGKCIHCHDPFPFDSGLSVCEREGGRTKEEKKSNLSLTKHVILSQLKREYGVTDREFQDEYELLKSKWKKDPQIQNVIWSLLNKKLETAGSDTQASILAYRMARFLHEENEDYSDFLRIHHRYRLTEFRKNDHITRVKISTFGCETCGERESEVLSLKTALQIQPLPRPGVHSLGWCTCSYVPISESDPNVSR